jgi:hypothetical protein
MSHHQVIPIAQTLSSPPPWPLSKPFLQTTNGPPDSACGPASPGPAGREDYHIADLSSASSTVQVPAQIVKLRTRRDEQTEQHIHSVEYCCW